MKPQEINQTPVTPEEYGEIKTSLEQLACKLPEYLVDHVKESFRFAAAIRDYKNELPDLEAIQDEARDEKRLIELLEVISRVGKRYNNNVTLPEYESLKQEL